MIQLSVTRDELHMIHEGLALYQKERLGQIAKKSQEPDPAVWLVKEAQSEMERALEASHVIVQIKALLKQSENQGLYEMGASIGRKKEQIVLDAIKNG